MSKGTIVTFTDEEVARILEINNSTLLGDSRAVNLVHWLAAKVARSKKDES